MGWAGSIDCLLCGGLVAYSKGSAARLDKHMEVEHGVRRNKPYLLAGCLMTPAERSLVTLIIEQRVEGKTDKEEAKKDNTKEENKEDDTEEIKKNIKASAVVKKINNCKAKMRKSMEVVEEVSENKKEEENIVIESFEEVRE